MTAVAELPSLLDGAFLTMQDRETFDAALATPSGAPKPAVAVRLHATRGVPVYVRLGTSDAKDLVEVICRPAHAPPIDLTRGNTIVHIGCAQGYATAMLAARFPDARIFAVAASPECVGIAERMLSATSACTRVIAGAVGSIDLAPPPGSGRNRLFTLGGLIEDLGLVRVDYAIVNLHAQPQALAAATPDVLTRIDALRVWCATELQAHWAHAMLQAAGMFVNTDPWRKHALVAFSRTGAPRRPRFPRNEPSLDPGPGQW